MALIREVSLRGWLAALMLVLLGWLSFHYNQFGVVADRTFHFGQSISERLVIEGMIQARTGGELQAPLGRYTRFGDTPLTELPPATLAPGNQPPPDTGPYRPYLSQYGLQGVLWAWTDRVLNWSIETMRAVNVLLLALIVAGLGLVCTREFGLRSGLWFSVPLVLSPQFVIYAHDLYWMSWSWLLPVLVTFALGRRAWTSMPVLTGMLVLYGLALLFKLLCGYEYMTTVVLAACAPHAYFGFEQRRTWPAVLGRMVAMAVVTVVVFGVAVGFHATRFGTLSSGLMHIGSLAEKRLYSTDPLTAAKDACQDDFWQDPECVPVYLESLNASVGMVLAKYAAPKYMLPWFARLESDSPPSDIKEAVNLAARNRSPAPVLDLVRSEGVAVVLPYLPRVFSLMVVPGLLLALAVQLARRRHNPVADLSMIVLSILAPLSWFIAAKGHSYIHVELNSVLWYVTFIPTALCLLARHQGGAAPDQRPLS